jgi:hypothetical protein
VGVINLGLADEMNKDSEMAVSSRRILVVTLGFAGLGDYE